MKEYNVLYDILHATKMKFELKELKYIVTALTLQAYDTYYYIREMPVLPLKLVKIISHYARLLISSHN